MFELRDIKDWASGVSCTPTALSAITGKSPSEIGVLLKEAALEFDQDLPDELLPDYNINHWLRVIRKLGGVWYEAENHEDNDQRPTINEWMANHLGVELELVFCDDGTVGHVFATIDGDIVDTYTDGRRVKFTEVPEEFQKLRVKRTFLVSEFTG